ncbi:hypothetical protein GCM10010104_21060 [Streptomyces indiaensis]|uniref:Uncharacterized protein n=1 Tax=Streptomyces indiaensis TaxID=284033 RepID=A0ABP5Q8B4_9ACTN
MVTGSEPSWIAPFTGLSARQFGKMIAALRREGADPVRKGRPWSLPHGIPGPAGREYCGIKLTCASPRRCSCAGSMPITPARSQTTPGAGSRAVYGAVAGVIRALLRRWPETVLEKLSAVESSPPAFMPAALGVLRYLE